MNNLEKINDDVINRERTFIQINNRMLFEYRKVKTVDEHFLSNFE